MFLFSTHDAEELLLPSAAEPAIMEAAEDPKGTIRTDSVLIADDDPISRSIVESHFRKWGLNITSVSDGLSAWNELQKPDAPSLIVLDWMMPGFTGIDLCRKIRARRTKRYPYILLLTSRDAKQDLVQALDAGADDYLTKPFHASELQSRLKVGSRILQLQNDLLKKEGQLRHEAMHDRLTGLWNRGAILDFMNREIMRAARTRNSMGLLLLDIDHFKSINDTYGHQAGDEALQQVAERLAKTVRNYDWVGRYGGEEFVVVLCNSNADVVANCAERLRESIALAPLRVCGMDLPVTVSVGASISTSTDNLLQTADAALYRAKALGRNRVEIGW